MPSYTVYARAGTFTGYQRDALARSITILHSQHTGAPRSFVQTIFLPIEPGTHYVGAERTDPRGTWVCGHIRAGRSAEVRTAIAVGIRDALEEIAQIPRQFIWVYLNELIHTDMGDSNPRPLPCHGRSSRLAGSRWVASVQFRAIALSGSH